MLEIATMLGDQIGQAEQQAAALGRRELAPCTVPCRLRRLRRLRDLARTAPGDMADRRLGQK